MKKILAGLFAVLFLACAGCGQQESFSDKVLSDEESAAWCLHGNFKLADGTENSWNGKDPELYVKSSLKATSIKAVSEIDKDLAKTLNSKKVKYLYMYEGAEFGTLNSWTAKYHDSEAIYTTASSYVFKVAKLSYDAEDDVYSENQWIHDPKTAYTEALTSNIFMPTWQEKPDEWGFSWADNLVIMGAAAGKYTVIAAQYEAVEGKPQYGLAAIKTADVTEGAQTPEKQPLFVPADHTFGVIGSFEGSGWGTDVAMEKVSDTEYKAEITVAENDEFKVRTDGNWDTLNIGASFLDKELSEETLSGEDNIKVATAGTYVVNLKFSGPLNLPSLVVTLK